MFEINGDNLTIDSVYQLSRKANDIRLSEVALNRMQTSRNYIESEIKSGAIIYGVNTGFGALSSVHISESDIEQLQWNLIRSHAVGVGDPFSPEETRAIMLLRANTLARGHSGVRPIVVQKILEFLKHDVLPVIPQKGSLGASGDLAPLAHLALGLIGEGRAWDGDKVVNTGELLKKNKIEPLRLLSKEGLSLINGCQVMTAVGLLSCYKARELTLISDIVGAMSIEALRGSRSPFDPLISETRPHLGEKKTARNLRRLLGAESKISMSHEDCDRVQDAYSLRCIPAVHGAVKDTLRRAIEVLETEANSSTDNPLVFASDKKVLSCGNFHGEPVAFQMDFLAVAFNALANISQCRISRLINPTFSSLPAFLTTQGGLNSGLMIVEVSAASLVSENKIYAHPASVDSIPTSVDKEDHVSMGTIAARKFKLILENVELVLSMEMLSSMQALSLLAPLTPTAGVKKAFDELRVDVPLIEKDRIFSDDIMRIGAQIKSGQLLKRVSEEVGELEW